MKVQPASLSLTVGKTSQLNAFVVDASGNTVSGQTITYSMEVNNGTASVSSTGLVTANAVGTDRVVMLWKNKHAYTLVTVGIPPSPTPSVSPSATPSVTPSPVPSGTPSPIPTGLAPELPRVFLDTTFVAPQGGKTTTVPVTGNIQAAIDQASPGDTIVLQAGATYKLSSFTLRKKACTKPNTNDCMIVIRTSDMAGLPAEGIRVTPANVGSMAKIQNDNAGAAIMTDPGAQYYRLIGLEVTSVNTAIYGGLQLSNRLISLGGYAANQNQLSQIPHDIILDRMYMHGHPMLHCKRAVELNSARTSIIDSYVSEIHGVGQDTQAVGGWNGSGPFKIKNNYLEGSGENIIFGGSDPDIQGLQSADIEIVGNYVTKPMSWYQKDPSFIPLPTVPVVPGVTAHWLVKNLLETKNATRILIEGNIFENTWWDGQGVAISFKGSNQSGACPWCSTTDVMMRNNIIRHMPRTLNVLGDDPGIAKPSARISVINNLFDQANAADVASPADYSIFMGSGGTSVDLVVQNNSFLTQTPINGLIALLGPIVGFKFVNNVAYHGTYGIESFGGHGFDQSALDANVPGYVFTGNIIVGNPQAKLPVGNILPATLPSLIPAGVGADVNLINQMTAKVVKGS